jgi:hypothetical protein
MIKNMQTKIKRIISDKNSVPEICLNCITISAPASDYKKPATGFIAVSAAHTLRKIAQTTEDKIRNIVDPPFMKLPH